MTTGRLISQDERLRQHTSRVLVDIVIDQSASNIEILSGIYNPINKTVSLININQLASAYDFLSLSSKVQERKSLKNILWKRMVTHHLGKMVFVSLLWLIGILDLLLYTLNQPPLLHWFNDILLIFGGMVLMGTIILMNDD